MIQDPLFPPFNPAELARLLGEPLPLPDNPREVARMRWADRRTRAYRQLHRASRRPWLAAVAVVALVVIFQVAGLSVPLSGYASPPVPGGGPAAPSASVMEAVTPPMPTAEQLSGSNWAVFVRRDGEWSNPSTPPGITFGYRDDGYTVRLVADEGARWLIWDPCSRNVAYVDKAAVAKVPTLPKPWTGAVCGAR